MFGKRVPKIMIGFNRGKVPGLGGKLHKEGYHSLFYPLYNILTLLKRNPC